jgi:alkyl hydroperoxide reductase subunit AhpC
MKIPIIADFSREIAQKYGVLVPNSDPDDAGVPFRALFIISPTGILRQITVNDLPVGRNVDEIIRLIQAFQHNDKFGNCLDFNFH